MSGIDELIASESGQKQGPDIDSLIANESGATPAAPSLSPQAQPGFLSQLGRQVGLTARAAGNGVADALGTVVDPFDKLIGAKPASGIVRDAVNKYTPTPANGTESAVQSIGSAVANPLNLVGGEVAAPGSTLIGRAAGTAAQAAPSIGRAALGGAVQAGLAPTTDGEDLGDYAGNVAMGAAGGGLLGGAAAAAGRVLRPLAQNGAVQDLMSRGVNPTPGQIAGGAWNKAEQAATSLPIVGPRIAGARAAAQHDFNLATYNDALEPIGAQLPAGTTAGSEGVQAVRDATGAAYDALQGQAQFNYDGQLHRDIAGIRNQLSQAAPQSTLDQFDNILRNQITNKMDPNTGEMTGPQWNSSRSMLSTFERNNRMGQPSADQTSLANALGDLRDVMNQNVVRNSPPDLQDGLNAANLAYARYKRIESAAGSVGAMNNGNVFTPGQYMSAVRRGSTSAQRGTSTGLNADLAGNAQSVLGNTVPDSGTAGRGLLASLLLAPHALMHPGTLAAIPSGLAAYSPTGVRLIGRAMTQRPQTAQDIGRALGALTGPGAAVGGQLLPQQLQSSPEEQPQ
jgi:hypothetical protein